MCADTDINKYFFHIFRHTALTTEPQTKESGQEEEVQGEKGFRERGFKERGRRGSGRGRSRRVNICKNHIQRYIALDKH